jgi:hypothetical protein
MNPLVLLLLSGPSAEAGTIVEFVASNILNP